MRGNQTFRAGFRNFYLFASTAVVAMSMMPAQAVAQSQGDGSGASAAQSAPEAASGIADIVVTAERRSSSVQRSSLAIEVLSADDIASAGVTDSSGLTSLVPGVQVGSIGPAAQVYIRGVGDFGATALSNAAVAFNVDGVYVSRTQSVASAFYDLERVEVLKGPQGTLYGRNASGGAINFITKQPKLGERSLDLNFEAGNYDSIKAEGAVNLPVGENLSVRAAFQIVSRDGYTSTGLNDDKHESVRLRALWKPSEDTSLLLSGDYTHVGGLGGAFVIFPRLPNSSAWLDVTGPEAASIITTASSFIFPGAITPMDRSIAGQNIQLWNAHAELTQDLGFATLTFLPAYRYAELTHSTYPIFEYRVGLDVDPLTSTVHPSTSKQISAELRLSNDAEAVKWVAGLYFFDEKQVEANHVVIGALTNSFTDAELQTRSYAAFGQATVEVAPGFRLIAGGRYTYDRREMLLLKYRAFPSIGCFDPTIYACLMETLDGRKSFKNVSWKGGVEYDVAPQSMAYATVSRGFKAGGFAFLGSAAGGTTEPASYRPETLTAYEAGIKNRFWDNRLQVNLELFYWDYKDHQENVVAIDGNGEVGLSVVNAGKARQYGFSLDTTFAPTPNDTLHFGVEYLDSKYTEFKFEAVAAFIAPGSTACGLTPTGAVGVAGPLVTVDCSGFQVTRAPKWTGSASYSHRFDLANGGGIEAKTDLTFASSRWLAPEFMLFERAPSYVTVNASLRYNSPNETMSLTAFVRNIGNEAVYTGASQHPFIAGFVGASIGAPRTYGVSAAFHF